MAVARELGSAVLRSRSVLPIRDWPVRLGGLEGYAYAYLFQSGPPQQTKGDRDPGDDPATAVGFHLEYFLPRGRQMVTLVLQSSSPHPSQALEAAFARIASSFRSG